MLTYTLARCSYMFMFQSVAIVALDIRNSVTIEIRNSLQRRSVAYLNLKIIEPEISFGNNFHLADSIQDLFNSL